MIIFICEVKKKTYLRLFSFQHQFYAPNEAVNDYTLIPLISKGAGCVVQTQPKRPCTLPLQFQHPQPHLIVFKSCGPKTHELNHSSFLLNK